MIEQRVRRWALAGVAVGVATWLAAAAWMDLGYDANAYVATAHGWMRTGELVLAWGDVLTWAPTPPGHSHHFPPAYPLYLGAFFSAFGFGLAQAKMAALVASLALLGVVYLATRDLYGATVASVATALVALDPHVLWTTGMGFSEPLAMLLFTLTMWAILRSLRDEWWIAPAGAFAGLAYLARSSMGAFFVIAGTAGFAWRLWHRGWRRTVTSPWYALAIVLFVGIVGAWAWRNVSVFGWPNWETSPGVRGIPRWIWEHRPAFGLGLLVRLPLLALVLAPFVAFAWPEARRSFARIRDEHVSGLWLSVALVLVLGVIFSAAYFSMGPSWAEALRLDNMRYVMVGIVPLVWALAREADWSRRGTRRRFFALGAVLLAGGALVATFPAEYAPTHVAQTLDAHVRPGDAIAVAGAGKYPFYGYLSEPQTLTVYVWGNGPPDPEWIVSTYAIELEGYAVVDEHRVRHAWWPATEERAMLLARIDVARARGLTFA